MPSDIPVGMEVDADPNPARVPKGVPYLYADKVIDVIYGVSTSKIVFGNETGGGGGQPAIVLTMPTPSLFVAAQSIASNMMLEAFVSETEVRYKNIVAMLRGELSTIQPDAVAKPSE